MTLSLLRRIGQVVAVALVLSLFGLLVWRLTEDESSGIRAAAEQGKLPPAPDFTLSRFDSDGVVHLASLRGKVVVLNFWASWCAPCKEEAPVLEQTWRRHRGGDLVVVGAAWKDIRSEGRRFARENGMTYPLVDDGEALSGPYEVVGVPETVVIDRRGRVVGSVTGQLNARDELRDRYDELVAEALRT
jgi:cytochrome c biogenesis protein CcmG, thiol:disulfide interchange protein DsbE